MLSVALRMMRNSGRKVVAAVLLCLALLSMSLPVGAADVKGKAKSKKDAATASQTSESEQALYLKYLDYSKIVWPNPPSVTRVKYLNYFCCERYVPPAKSDKKASWMDRLAGGQSDAEKRAQKPLFALWTPFGMAVDSKGQLYVADGRVGAVFIFNTDNKDIKMIKNGTDAHFGFITGMAMDDNDRLFVADSHLHKVHVFDANHKFEASITEGIVDPAGLALDVENRFLYVVDPSLDQVLVYDADSYKLLRKIGTAGKNHTLLNEGNFASPIGAAVDNDGNLYVVDTLNNRVEEFDAEGNFIRAFGKAGDGPGTFMHPKGIAIDADGHVWVADTMQNRLQCFDQEGHLLMYIGGPGRLPGQFTALTMVYIDKQNRIFTSEQFPARVQMFRYFTNSEARAELDKRKKQEEERKNGKAAQAPVTQQESTAAGSQSSASPQ